jgi:hypothetical protein
MLSLREFQCAFCDSVLSGDAGPMLELVPEQGIPAEQGVQIYRNNYLLAALATLQATYPVIERLGGADWFRHSAASYQRQFPSKSGDLQHLGDSYPQFLQADLAGTAHAYFADVAALEWAYQEVLTAAEQAPVDLGSLRSFGPEDYERLVFVPRPGVRTIDSQFPIFAIWKANRSALDESAVSAESGAHIRLDAGASHVALIPRRDHVDVRELSPGGYQLLRQFQLGGSLAFAAAGAAAKAADFDLARSLREVMLLQAIGGIELGNADGGHTIRRAI